MGKYIDADKLKAHIQYLIKKDNYELFDVPELLSFIDSLQQEQPDFPTTDEQVKEFLATHPKTEVPEKYKSPDWLFKNHGQPEADLEKEIDACWQNWLSPSNQKEVEGVLPKTEFAMYARHFAEWQSKQDKETIELAEDHAFLAGADWQKEQMMKEVVEMEVGMFCKHLPMLIVTEPMEMKDFPAKHGQTVRVIVLPKDDSHE